MAAEGEGLFGALGGVRGRQWGRDRMAAEGLAHEAERVIRAERQWGRDRMAAEGGRFSAGAPAHTCVNGAATGWPRKVDAGGRQEHPQVGVNGAATGWPRKAHLCQGQAHLLSVASMGPRPDGRGRWQLGAGLYGQVPGVNGAATGWPRKEAAVFNAGRELARQWGRDRMAAEG